MVKEKKQFIAGAICPKCADEDSLVLFSKSKNIICVSCGFQQTSQQEDPKQETISTIKITQID